MGTFIDSLWGPSGIESTKYLALLAFLMVISTVLSTVSDYFLGLVTEETVFELRKRLVERVFRQPIQWYQNVSSGDWNSRITNDPERVRVSVNNGPVEIFLNASLVLGTIGVMLWISPTLVVVVLLVTLLGALVVLVLSSRLDKSVGTSQQKIGQLSENVVSGFENIRSIRGNNGVDQYTQAPVDILNDTYELGRNVAKNKSFIVPIGEQSRNSV